jgi:hypothetical protein
MMNAQLTLPDFRRTIDKNMWAGLDSLCPSQCGTIQRKNEYSAMRARPNIKQLDKIFRHLEILAISSSRGRMLLSVIKT